MNQPSFFVRAAQACLVTGLLLVGNACNQTKDEVGLDPDAATAQADGLIDQLLLNGVQLTEDAFDGKIDGVSPGRTESCALFNWDIPRATINLNFGTGCLGDDGVNRSGQIRINYTNLFHQNDAQITVTFTNYAAEGHTLNGTLNLGNFRQMGRDRSSYSMSVRDFVVTFPDGDRHVFTAQRTIESGRVRGHRDNEWRITGSGSGTNRDGETYTVNITEPIIVRGSCLARGIVYPVSGKYNLRVANRPAGQLDWGSGNCDKQATFTTGSTTIVIDFP
ncbi:MAG: hypothetical protein MUC97_11670 [Bernardetiaceae bacterium]|jgi:hypothetical protein|nr:hypothetical protein [Bernardetiaceae bacterium]